MTRLSSFNPAHTARCRCDSCKDHHNKYRKWLETRNMSQGSQLIDATGTKRRIRALQALGWPMSRIAVAAGETRTLVANVANHNGKMVTRPRAARIEKAYRELSGRVGPSVRARSKAKARGYVPPLSWDNIDDPAEQPKGVPVWTGGK